jgi:hypothetical protein
MNLKDYESKQSNYNYFNIIEPIEFLSNFSIASMDTIEVEMCLMHAANILHPSNEFFNNYNVKNKDIFIDHVALIADSDASAWSRKLNDYNLWNAGNPQIANLSYNWICGKLDDPEVFVQ